MKQKGIMKRRDFISSAAIIGVGSTVSASGVLGSCVGRSDKLVPLRPFDLHHDPNLEDEVAIDGDPLKVGLIGCGGRGTGSATCFLDAGPNIHIVALGDVFQDRIDRCRKALKDRRDVDISDSMCFTGFDNYLKVIDSDIDIVILATPAAFRPIHFKAAVEAGKHVFMEKPACVDPTGYRSICATARQAEAQGLCVVAGTMHRYQRAYLEGFKLILDGIIGEIVSGSIYWGAGLGWIERTCDAEWSDMEYMIRSWQAWRWLGGGIMEELTIHHIDLINWLLRTHPILAFGQGARQRGTTGDTFDMISANYEYEGGINFSSMSYRIAGNDNRQSEFIQGTKGSFESVQWGETLMDIRDLKGNIIWKWDPEKEKQEFKHTGSYGGFVLEIVDLINHIHKRTPINQAQGLADSSLSAIMGREAAHTGRIITWDEISNSTMNLLPDKLEFGPMDMDKFVVPVPGDPERKGRTYTGRMTII